MTKKELMEMGLEEALAERVLEAHVEQMRGYVPRSRLNEEIAARRAAEERAAEQEEAARALRAADNSEELKRRIRELEELGEKQAGQHAEEIRRMRVDRAVEAALIGAKARNVKAAKALLSGLEEAEIGEGGEVKGLSEQIERLRQAEDSRFLFESGSARKMKGAFIGEDGLDEGDGDVSRMSYGELAAFMAQHPGVKPV